MHVGFVFASFISVLPRAFSRQWERAKEGKAQEVQERKLSLIQHVMLMMTKKKTMATLNERRTL